MEGKKWRRKVGRDGRGGEEGGEEEGEEGGRVEGKKGRRKVGRDGSVGEEGGEEEGEERRGLYVCLHMSFQVLLLCHHYVGWAARSQHHDKVFKL